MEHHKIKNQFNINKSLKDKLIAYKILKIILLIENMQNY